MSLQAVFPIRAATAETDSRTIAGLAVPFGELGTVSDGRLVRFEPGSLDVTARPVVLRDHDRARPIGRVVDAAGDARGVTASCRISRTRDGDEALVLAADGALGAFSVGVNPTQFHHDGDVLVVDAADWEDLSLLTHGAFMSATVATVTAQSPIDPEPEPEQPDDDPEGDDMPEQASTIRATRQPGRVPLAASTPAQPPLTLSRVAALVAAANRNEMSGAQLTAILGDAQVKAATSTTGALENVLTSNTPGIVQPAYLSEIRGLIVRSRATIDAIQSAPLPASGMSLNFPKWTTQPAVSTQATQKTAIPTEIGRAHV